MKEKHYNRLVKDNRMPGTGETSTSPTQAFSEGYKGVLVKFKVKRGTIDELENIGISAANNEDVLLEFNKLKPDVSPWNEKYARFKLERDQINIALGKGDALDIFNDNILEFEFVKKIVK